MRLFIFARHSESAANTARLMNSDPAHHFALTGRGKRQARLLGEQLAHLEIDLGVCTRFLRTRQTIDLVLGQRGTPLRVEPDLDEVQAGVFDGAPITDYWAWKERHQRSERFPGGESLDETARRYAEALRRLLSSDEHITLIVCHELALRYIIEAAGGPSRSRPQVEIANAVPYLFDEQALRNAFQCLDALAPAPLKQLHTDVAA